MTKTLKVLALALCAMVALSGCALVAVNPEKEAAEVVARVGNDYITRGDVEPILSLYYQMYGIGTGAEYKSDRDTLKQMIVDDAVQLKVEEQYAKELGVYQPSDNEMDSARQNVIDEEYQYLLEEWQAMAEEDSSINAEAKAKEDLDKFVAENEVLIAVTAEQELRQLWLDKLYEEVVKEISVTDDEIQKEYERLLAEQPSTYEAKPEQYSSDIDNGVVAVAIPAGYRRVKHILVALAAEAMDEITEQRYYAQETEDYAEAVAYNEEGDRIRAEHLLGIEEKANSILDRVNDGEDFDALMAEFGEDPGMQEEPGLSEGYLLCATSPFTVGFPEAVFSLTAVGQNTGLVATDYGYHIIKYIAEVEPRTIPLEEVSEALHTQLLEAAQNKLYSTTISTRLQDTRVETFLDRLP